MSVYKFTNNLHCFGRIFFVKWYLDFCEILFEFQSSAVYWTFSMQILKRYRNFMSKDFLLFILLFFMYYEILRFLWNSFRVSLFIFPFFAVFQCLIQIWYPTWSSNLKLAPCRKFPSYNPAIFYVLWNMKISVEFFPSFIIQSNLLCSV